MLLCRRYRGYSLVELMVVVMITAIIAGFLSSAIMVARTRGKIRQNEIFLKDVSRAVDLMKKTYEYTGAIGVDDKGEPLTPAELLNIDIGWELDPKNELWGPGGKVVADLHFNRRRMSFYTVKKSQVSAGHFVDVFGNNIIYNVVERTETAPDGSNVRLLDEYLISYGPDGEPNTGVDDDDQMVKVGTYKIRQ